MRQTKLVFLFFIILAVSGCATCKNKELEIQGLKNELSILKSQIDSRDEEIAGLKDALTNAQQEKEALYQKTAARKKYTCEVKSRPNTKQIQIALKNAGYNPGVIDGKMGKQTKEAIRLFQRNNSLMVTGKVGKKTWKLLRKYLYKKAT